MTKMPRIAKTPEQRLRACETHLYFLWDTRRLYPQQRDRYKQIAAELRILVCKTRANKPLLLNLMDEFGFSYKIQPPGRDNGGPPLKPQPLPMVGWREDPIHKKLSEEVEEAIKSGDDTMMRVIEAKLEALARPVPFREWVNKGLAVFISPHDYSYRELVLAIAQQFGSSHEDDAIDEPIAQLQQFIIGGETSEISTLIGFADQVINVGSQFLGHLVQHHGYKPQYFKQRN